MKGPSTVELVRLSSGRRARLVRCAGVADAAAAVTALGLPCPAPVVVVNGSTDALPDAVAAAAACAFADAVVPVATQRGAVVVTGATDAGVIALLGRALRHAAAAGPPPLCLGVAPAGTTTWPGRTDAPGAGAVPLEPHHSHFLIVDGDEWGAETSTMLAVAAQVSGPAGSVALLVGGGPVAAREVEGHLAAGRPVVTVAGSGRLADEVAGRVHPAAAEHTDLVAEWRLTDPPAALRTLLAARLERP